MVHILQKDSKDVKEIYVTDGITTKSHYVLMLLEDGTVRLTWYYEDTRVEKKDPCLVKCLNGMNIEFDSPHEDGTRSFMEFLDYDSGKLCENWERIK